MSQIKEKAAQELKQEVNEIFPFFEKAILEAKSGFIGKGGVSWVDFLLESFTLTLENLVPGILKDYVNVNETIRLVNALPQLKSYLKNRKKTII